jgi:hypothetical protein
LAYVPRARFCPSRLLLAAGRLAASLAGDGVLLVLARPRIAGLAAAVRAVAGLDGTAVVGRRPLRLRASARCSWRELSVSPDTY